MEENKNIRKIKNGCVSFNKDNNSHYICVVDYVEDLYNNTDYGKFHSFEVDFSEGIYANENKYKLIRILDKEEINKDFILMIYNYENNIIIPKLNMFVIYQDKKNINSRIVFSFEGCGLNCKIVKIEKQKVFFVCENSVFI